MPETAAATGAARHMSPLDWVRWLTPGVVWGTSFYFIAEGLEAFPAALITPMRIAFGFLTLALVPAARAARIDRVDWRRLALLGVIWMAVPLSIFPFAEQTVSSSVVGMLNGATPIFVTTVAAGIARRMPGTRQLAGIALGFAGVALIALPAGTGESSWGGVALIIGALVFYGFALNVAVPLQQRYGALATMWRVQGVAFLLTAPFAITSADDIATDSPRLWPAFAALVGLGVLGTALAYVMMADNAGRLGSTRASASVYLIPVVSLLLGALVRHEHVDALSIAGCAVALVGAYVATSSR
ncbi:MAG: DMT family transporter [Ilumatobacteraceae bacterium]